MCKSREERDSFKTVYFSEEQLSDIQSIGDVLFDDKNDPKSWSYKRVLVRPNINWFRVLGYIIVPLVLMSVLFLLLTRQGVECTISLLCCVGVFVLYAVVTAKRALICAVRIYQRYAPDGVRNKCRFEPSCSQYMILSLEKYGVIRGTIKGVVRLKRCNIGDGGFDEP